MRQLPSRTYQISIEQLKRHRSTIALTVLLILIATALDVLTPLLFRFLVDEAIASRDIALITGAVAGSLLLPVVSSAMSFLEGHLRGRIGTAVAQALRQQAFEHTLSIEMKHLEQRSSGGLLHLILSKCGEVGEVFVGDHLLPIVSRLLFFLGNIAAMFALNWQLATVTILAVPTLFILRQLLYKRLEQIDERLYALMELGTQLIHEALAAVRMIRALNGQPREAARWRDWGKQFRQSRIVSNAAHGFFFDSLSSFLNSLVLAVVFGFGIFEILGGRLSIGTLIAFLVYAPRVLAALQQLSRTHLYASEARVAADKLDELFALPLERSGGAVLPVTAASEQGMGVIFDRVSFRYERGEAGISDLSFNIRPGEFVGVVGPSGGGKSTIFELLLGMYAPEGGQILIDGADLGQLLLTALRAEMGVVFQDTFLWNTSLSANLAYPHDPAQLDRDMEWAIQAAQAGSFVASLPAGLKTIVGERGHALSGGERQRIAIARALLRKPRLLLLDEATAALDPLTELNIRNSLMSLRQNRTTIVIAHRMTTVAQADQIIVIDQGKLVEQGSPQDLLERRGLFYAFCEAQNANTLE